MREDIKAEKQTPLCLGGGAAGSRAGRGAGGAAGGAEPGSLTLQSASSGGRSSAQGGGRAALLREGPLLRLILKWRLQGGGWGAVLQAAGPGSEPPRPLRPEEEPPSPQRRNPATWREMRPPLAAEKGNLRGFAPRPEIVWGGLLGWRLTYREGDFRSSSGCGPGPGGAGAGALRPLQPCLRAAGRVKEGKTLTFLQTGI